MRYSEGRKGFKLNRVRKEPDCSGSQFSGLKLQFSILDGKTAKQAGKLQEICTPELEAATLSIGSPKAEALT